MFKNLHISLKVFVIIAPLLMVMFGTVVFTTYQFEERQVLELSQLAAESQATLIKNSLVHMMQTQEEVDDAYLRSINAPGELENIRVLFRLDSLHLKKEYLTNERVMKLQDRERRTSAPSDAYVSTVYGESEPLWIMTCDIQQHASEADRASDVRLTSLQGGIPAHFWSCGRLRIIQPFIAERKCLSCHEVRPGQVLGAASMELPIGKTVATIRTNAIRSVIIFLVLSVLVTALGTLIFRRFVSRPVQRLVDATREVGAGNLNLSIRKDFEGDEFGLLAEAFEDMQHKLKDARDELINKERLSTLGQMASGIIHDFRSPMTNISIGLHMLETQTTLAGERRAEIFRLVRDSLDRMVRMTQELLEFAKGVSNLQLVSVDIREFMLSIESQVRPHLERNRITLAIDPPESGSCVIDPDRLQRSIINLVNNAEDAMQNGGSLVLRARRTDGIVQFSVEDTGPGIPAEIRSAVFEPYVTHGKVRGTGLGLAIAKRVVEQHGGVISFDSTPGKGTTFIITLPAGRNERISAPPTEVPAA